MASRGPSLCKQAEEALVKKSFLGVFGIGNDEKYEKAADLFTKSGNAYKTNNQLEEAGMMYERAAECYRTANNKLDALKCTVDSASAFKNATPPIVEKAIDGFTAAIDQYSMDGKFGQAAKYYKEIAELCENANDMDAALTSYENAAQMYTNDNKPSESTKCLIKVATMASEKGNFQRACEIFDKAGKDSMQSRLGQYSAKGYFFQSLLCHLASGDSVSVGIKIEEYEQVDYTFPTSRECQLVKKLLEATDNMDADAFGEACFEFNRISPLDPWKTSMLAKSKGYIASNDGDGDVDLT